MNVCAFSLNFIQKCIAYGLVFWFLFFFRCLLAVLSAVSFTVICDLLSNPMLQMKTLWLQT